MLLVADNNTSAVLVNPPPSSGNAGTNAIPVGSIAALDLSTSSQASNGNGKNAAQVITLSGVSRPAPLNVVYHRGSQPVVSQALPTLVDVIIGIGLGTSSNANGSVSNATITSLTQDIISGKKSS